MNESECSGKIRIDIWCEDFKIVMFRYASTCDSVPWQQFLAKKLSEWNFLIRFGTERKEGDSISSMCF